MSTGNFRARRPASPPLNGGGLAGYPPQSSQRFPHNREDHLDADQRLREARLDSKPFSKRQHSQAFGGIKMTAGEWQMLIAICVLAVGVRLYKLSSPNSVVFDEVHFGKFASKYIKTQYYVDVHPPLAKLLITLFAFVGGYDGEFDFKEIGKVYENVPYVVMRSLPATLGVALVPITYMTLRALDCRATTAALGSLFMTFENGLITQSRHILLDSPLVFFTALTTLLWVGFTNENKQKPFTESWWLWLTLSGLSLGAVLSCKWVGLFTTATVGLSTLRQLWILLGDLKVSPRMWMKHFLARALCLIVVPVLFYMAMFEIHFLILENSGDGDGFMSSAFQHTLGGRQMSDTYADVALGSTVTLRHWNTQGGYLHSHAHNYPGGSKQQQITLYPHRDENNDFRLLNTTAGEGEAEFDWEHSPLQYVTPGMQLRFEHISTGKRLHSHDFRPPMTETDFQNEVSGYGFEGFAGDANDYWTLEIYKGDRKDRQSGKRLRTLRTRFRLRHALSGCYLFSHKVKLPDWGFEQQEVTCNKNAPVDNSLWFIETNTHPMLPQNAPKVNYRLPGFLSKFLELQQVMWTTNAGLTDRHNFDSRPEHWPRLRRGINFWVKDHRQIYLIGNPWIWWLSTAAIGSYVAIRGLLIVRAKRGYTDFNNSSVVKYDELCGFLFMGWSLHYFPFFLMSRQLFLHHYFPALYFAVLLFCAAFDLASANVRRRVRVQVAAVLIMIAVWNYWQLSPLAYGSQWTKAKCNSSKWMSTWDFACNDFYEDYSQYSEVAGATSSSTPLVTIGGGDDGRPPIVVEEPKDDGKPFDTTIIPNQPEPGPNVFHKDPPKDIQSESEAKRPQEEHDVTTGPEKVIETVSPAPPPDLPPPVQPIAGGTASEGGDTTSTQGDEPPPPANEETTHSVESKGDMSVSEKTVGVPEPAPVNKEQKAGPIGEDAAERERVMHELYGTTATQAGA